MPKYFINFPSTNNVLNREVMTFYLPVIEAADPDSSEGSIPGITINGNGSSMIKGRQFFPTNPKLKFYKKKLYLNPQSISTSNKKLMNKQLTKGGFFIQYWGEDLVVLQIQGTTGSAGISEINKLLSIYRHEQIHFKDLLNRKNKNFISTIQKTMVNISENSTESEYATLEAIDDLIFGGQGQSVVNSIGTAIDTVQDLYYGTGLQNSNQKTKYGSFQMEATLATLATSLLMEFKGMSYRGYIDNFSFSETAAEPGIFSYNFTFNVLYSNGVRKNYMPWHIESEVDGVSKIASVPILGTEDDNYTYPYQKTTEGIPQEEDFSVSSGESQSVPDDVDEDFENSQQNRNFT